MRFSSHCVVERIRPQREFEMTADEILVAALEKRTPVERAAYLDGACGVDGELRALVENLLRSHEEAGSFLEQPLFEPAQTIDQPRQAETPGTVIGPYKLLQQIGEGGMGTVFMAEQTEPVKRKVALKVIKAGMDSRQVVARFEAERQALAMMDHVNIARVFDGGTTENGRPFFVLELVHGVPITKYCDDNHLTPRQRLELFVPVCQAIQHAHQKGIIHRDIKPSNVMVTLYDGKPVPKVIDFGVAKATEQKLTERTLFTQYGTMIGTLEYMSPEQAEMSALGVDTRSDIYSLGVLLYELLTGSTPLTHKRMKEAAYGEILRMIKEEEPPKPSTRLSDSGEALASISAQRKTEPAKLAKLMRGELDWIVMKTLEKDRNRRYETANGFAADVQRYLADEAVQACPPSASYRLRKFVARNKGPVIAASVILLCLVVAILGTSAGLVWAVRERDAKTRALSAETEAKEAAIEQRQEKEKALTAETKARAAEQQARDKALDALRALTDDIVENQMARGTKLTDENKEFLRTIIRQFEGFAAITANDAESRAIRAEGHFRVGRMRHRLGELKEAEAAYADALALQKPLAADFPTRPDFRQQLAGSQHSLGILLHDAGRLKEAEAVNGDALALRKQLAKDFPTRPEFRSDLAGSHNNLASLFHHTGRPKETEAAYADALVLWKQLVADFPTRPKFRQELAINYNNLGIVHRETGRPKEAEVDFGYALALRKQLAKDFPTRPDFRQDLADSHNSLGVLLRAMGHLKKAEAAYADALALRKQLAADFPTRPDFRSDLAESHNNLGNVCRDSGRPKEAEAAYADALALQKQLVKDFPTRAEFRFNLAGCHSSLGGLLYNAGRFEEAEAAYADALALQKQLVKDFPTRAEFRQDLASSHNNLGVLFNNTGRLKKAEAAYADALALRKQLAKDFPTRPEFRRDLAGSHNNLGVLLRETGRLKEAEAAYADALALRKQLAKDFPNRPDLRSELAGIYGNLADLRLGARDFEAAKGYLEQATPHLALALAANPRHPRYRSTYGTNLRVLVQANAGLGDQVGAKRAAEKLRDFGGKRAVDAYDAACFLSLCIPIVQKDEQATKEERGKQVQFYGDEAMKLLRDAVAKGYKDATHMRQDKDLDSLRDRPDFEKLLAGLEAGKDKDKK